MDYEQKYKDALERAKGLLEGMDEGDYFASSGDIENIFPELKESEDERIRKGLIKAVSGILKGNTLYGTDVTREEALAWLEKQGKQTHAKLCQSEVTKTSDQELSDKVDVRTMTAWQSGYKEAIEKACEWLEQNAYHYCDDIDTLHESALIGDFRHVMKEE